MWTFMSYKTYIIFDIVNLTATALPAGYFELTKEKEESALVSVKLKVWISANQHL